MMSTNFSADRIGKHGEAKFDELCLLADLIVSGRTPDMTGKDRLVEFPFVEATGNLTYDTRPVPLACYVQIKTLLEDNHRIKMRLSVAERLVGEIKPAFICVFRINLDWQFVDMHLLHVADDVLAAILKRLRAENSKGTVALNKLWISLDISAGIEVKLDPMELRKVLQMHIGSDMHSYSERKRLHRAEVGYEPNRFRGNLKLKSTSNEDLLDGFLGLKELSVVGFKAFERRFGIDMPNSFGDKNLGNLEAGSMKISPNPIDQCSVSLSSADSRIEIEYIGDLFVPVMLILPMEENKILVKCDMFDIFIKLTNMKFVPNENWKSGKLNKIGSWVDGVRTCKILSEGGGKLSIKSKKNLIGDVNLPNLPKLDQSNPEVNYDYIINILDKSIKLRDMAGVPDTGLELADLMDNGEKVEIVYSMMTNSNDFSSLDFGINIDYNLQSKDLNLNDYEVTIFIGCLKIGADIFAYAVRSKCDLKFRDEIPHGTCSEFSSMEIALLNEPRDVSYQRFREKMTKISGINFCIQQEIVEIEKHGVAESN